MSPSAKALAQRLEEAFPGEVVKCLDPHSDGTFLEVWFAAGAVGGGPLEERHEKVLQALPEELLRGVEALTLRFAPEGEAKDS